MRCALKLGSSFIADSRNQMTSKDAQKDNQHCHYFSPYNDNSMLVRGNTTVFNLCETAQLCKCADPHKIYMSEIWSRYVHN